MFEVLAMLALSLSFRLPSKCPEWQSQGRARLAQGRTRTEQASLHPSASSAVQRGDEDLLRYLKVKRDERVAYSPFSLPCLAFLFCHWSYILQYLRSCCSSPTASAKWKWKTLLGVLHSEHQTDPSPPQLLPHLCTPKELGEPLPLRGGPPGRVIDKISSILLKFKEAINYTGI